MMTIRKLLALGLLMPILIACSSFSKSDVSDTEIEFYRYQSVSNAHDFVLIRADQEGGEVSYHDMVNSDQVSSLESDEVKIIAPDLNLVFYLPPDYSDTLPSWVFGGCVYTLMDKAPHKFENGTTTFLNYIAGDCSDLKQSVLYVFSKSDGLQGFSFGELISDKDGGAEFKIFESYALVAQRVGLGHSR